MLAHSPGCRMFESARAAARAVSFAVAVFGCTGRPTDYSAPARKTCEDQLSQRLGGFPGFPPEDSRNGTAPLTLPSGLAPAYQLRGVVEADGIKGIYDCQVMSPDSGRTWKVLDLKFNAIKPEPVS
jgi:hypothetical protein